MIRIISIVLLIFNSISALGGGAVLIIDPTGDIMQMSVDILWDSPFANFMVPGVILFIILGVGSALAALTAIKKKKKYYIDTISVGIVTIVWIAVELYMIKSVDLLHYVYGGLGLVFVVLGMMESRIYKTNTETK
jgi:hypothetical protein